ncbi:MAG: Zn-ribbon domain-containing OB-fold protein [Paenalcaligenes sp.]
MTQPLPPHARSSTALHLNHIAESGSFSLQVCQECQTVQYPPRDVCSHCLGPQLQWQAVESTATLVAQSTLHHSNEPYFQAKLPWHIGTAKLDCGPVAIVNLPSTLPLGQRLQLTLTLDASHSAVLTANPID